MNILLTGGTGFVGQAVLNKLMNEGHRITAVVRGHRPEMAPAIHQHVVADMLDVTDWASVLENQHAIIHAAARVHVMNEIEQNPLEAFRRVNVDATLQLANAAARAGIKRFVFISSVKVNGEATLPGAPFDESSTDQPSDAYGHSKKEAEDRLFEVAGRTGMEVVVVRPVLVYGPGVGANFLSLMRWVDRGVPLPLGAIHNKRSFVSIGNLADFIIRCASHPAAANQVFLISDGEDMSTSELLRRMSNALGVPDRLIGVPSGLLLLLGKLSGKGAEMQRLCGSLQVDISKARRLLCWNPPISVEQSLAATAESFKKGRT